MKYKTKLPTTISYYSYNQIKEIFGGCKMDTTL